MLRFSLYILFSACLVACESGTSGQIDTNGGAIPAVEDLHISATENIKIVYSFDFNQDPSDNVITYAVTGGADELLLSVGLLNTSEIIFNDAPDFEAPADANGDNIYELEITGTLAGTSRSASQLVYITVTDVASAVAETKTELNDTGVVVCGDYSLAATHNNDIDCVSGGATDPDDAMSEPQDANNGRDNMSLASPSNLTKLGAGPAGFDFTKLNAQGEPVSSGALAWACVQDHVTGLVWEVKQDMDLYTWYSTDSANDGGAPGAENSETSCADYNAADTASYCNTEAYIARVNADSLCGSNQWRLPSPSELQGIINYGEVGAPRISTDYFANTQAGDYWSANPASATQAWTASFATGGLSSQLKTSALAIRLVRDQ